MAEGVEGEGKERVVRSGKIYWREEVEGFLRMVILEWNRDSNGSEKRLDGTGTLRILQKFELFGCLFVIYTGRI